ncbi:phosphatidylinositide phosphatase SAC2 [Ceratobasidium sp. AG-Ba]|nr:phosphatidylinositide phosphatase SAC2 [Ceratobasidium sp. AG-Ba]
MFARFAKRQSKPPVQPPQLATPDAHPRAFTVSADGHHTTLLPPRHIAPPVPHPSPYARLILHAADEGLLIRPDVEARQCASYVCVSWGGANVNVITTEEGATWDGPVVYGVVGVITIYSETFLLVISDRKQAGTLFSPSRPVHTIKSITAIPLRQDQARTALNGPIARKTPLTPNPLRRNPDADPETPAEDVPDLTPAVAEPKVKFAPEPPQVMQMPETNDSSASLAESSDSPTTSGASTPLSSASASSLSGAPVAKTLVNRLTFWSKPRTVAPAPPSLDTATAGQDNSPHIPGQAEQEPEEALHKILDAGSNTAPSSTEERNAELTKKIVREIVRQYSSGCMYYSLDFDLSTSLQDKHDQFTRSQHDAAVLEELAAAEGKLPSTPAASSPQKLDPFAEPHGLLSLWLRVPQKSRRYWWNENLAAPFVEAGAHSYVVPILQGHFQSASFNVGEGQMNEEGTSNAQVVEYALISRRSRDRAGLRYQRRGIDDDSNVANFVETEGVLRVTRFGSENVFSYVQIRGSIPLFWSQPGLALKPPPKLDRPVQDALPAARAHFSSCSRTCTIPNGAGMPITCVNLVEKTGKEAVVGSGFDFHAECRGMKYENISKLVTQLERTFESQGYFWVLDGQPVARQRGVFRTNCIDCLDRTNVVQSAFARYVMNHQLQAITILNPDPADVEADMVFNDVWANNGDAISRAYAGTSALKGDFTRTGRRDISGMLNDGRNSLARMYTSNFADYFSQATIDFMLGHRTTTVFSEFLLQLSSKDPREILKVSKIRASAIETTIARVVLEFEHAVNAWTLLSPAQVGVAVADKFVEKILVLTASAIYIVSFDYEMDKVVSSRRVPLGDIVSIKQGAYILSTLHEASKDPIENYGFSITYRNTHQDIRLTTYSMRNKPALPSPTLSSTDNISPQITPVPTPTTPRATFPPLKRASVLRRGSGMLSQILSSSAANVDAVSDIETVSFKALPVLDVHPDQVGVAPVTCRDVARRIVRDVWAGCKSIGNGHQNGFVVDEDIVSLQDAQRITPVWAQLEYSFKRFLWLGT